MSTRLSAASRLQAVQDMIDLGLLCSCPRSVAFAEDVPIEHRDDCTAGAKMMEALNCSDEDYDIKSGAAGGDGDLL